ncbi:MAG: prenyltransferase/squalene oxidase repeat-containing protein [Candidatus Nanopelagicales bacterium]
MPAFITRSSRLAAFTGLAAALATGLLAAPPANASAPTVVEAAAQAGAPASTLGAADAAAGWLAGQFVDGAIPSTWNPGANDWGLTADAVLALASRKVGATAANAATDALAAHAADYARISGSGTGSAGALAKLLLTAIVQGRDVHDFGGTDLAAGLANLRATSGANEGRYQDSVVGSDDYSGSFSQSLAVIAFARLGTVPPSASSALVAMQCPNGGFPYSPTSPGSPACTDNNDVTTDTTAMAVQALSAPGVGDQPGVSAAKADAIAYLKAQQRGDGSFIDSPAAPWGNANASSTGLVASALRLVGETSAADQATAYVADQQLTCANAATSKAAAYLGAITYDPASRAATIKDGVADADQPRRTTAQAILAFAGSDSFVTMDGTDSVATARRLGCTPTKTAQAPTPPVITGLSWIKGNRSVVVSFKPTSGKITPTAHAYRTKKISRGSKWSGWKPMRGSTRSFTTSNARFVEVRSVNGSTASVPRAVFANLSTTSGSLRGCAAVESVAIDQRGKRSVVKFGKRSNSCAQWRVSVKPGSHFGRWSSLRKASSKVSVSPRSAGPARLQIRTGKRTVTVYVSR